MSFKIFCMLLAREVISREGDDGLDKFELHSNVISKARRYRCWTLGEKIEKGLTIKDGAVDMQPKDPNTEMIVVNAPVENILVAAKIGEVDIAPYGARIFLVSDASENTEFSGALMHIVRKGTYRLPVDWTVTGDLREKEGDSGTYVCEEDVLLVLPPDSSFQYLPTDKEIWYYYIDPHALLVKENSADHDRRPIIDAISKEKVKWY